MNNTDMNAKEARQLGQKIAVLVQEGRIEAAYARLAPTLAERTPFPMLERIGRPAGELALQKGRAFANRIATEKTEGGWVVVGAILREQIQRDPSGSFHHCRTHILTANVWYAADILGERVPGPDLVNDFEKAFMLLPKKKFSKRLKRESFVKTRSAWLRRLPHYAVHFTHYIHKRFAVCFLKINQLYKPQNMCKCRYLHPFYFGLLSGIYIKSVLSFIF
jgi:hypothetical protein